MGNKHSKQKTSGSLSSKPYRGFASPIKPKPKKTTHADPTAAELAALDGGPAWNASDSDGELHTPTAAAAAMATGGAVRMTSTDMLMLELSSLMAQVWPDKVNPCWVLSFC